MAKSQSEKRHNKGVEAIVLRLLEKNYDAVLMNPIYRTPDYCGELDILAIRGGVAHYYEIKGHESGCSYRHAKRQIHRVQRAFPQWKVRGVYFPLDGSPQRVN